MGVSEVAGKTRMQAEVQSPGRQAGVQEARQPCGLCALQACSFYRGYVREETVSSELRIWGTLGGFILSAELGSQKIVCLRCAAAMNWYPMSPAPPHLCEKAQRPVGLGR